jgi:hypothetical protein
MIWFGTYVLLPFPGQKVLAHRQHGCTIPRSSTMERARRTALVCNNEKAVFLLVCFSFVMFAHSALCLSHRTNTASRLKKIISTHITAWQISRVAMKTMHIVCSYVLKTSLNGIRNIAILSVTYLSDREILKHPLLP